MDEADIAHGSPSMSAYEVLQKTSAEDFMRA